LSKIAGMKKILVFLLIQICIVSSVTGYNRPEFDYDHWRKMLFSLNEDSHLAYDFFQKIDEIENPAPLTIAYKGTILAHMAKSSTSFFDQIKYLSKSLNLLDQAVSFAPENPEIRFLRFAVQVQLPSIVRSATKIKADRKFLENNYHRIAWKSYPSDEAQYIRDFLSQYNIQ